MAGGVNKAIIIGNLGRDPELRYTQGGQPVCRLAVATSRRFMNKRSNEMVEETEWHRITVWGKQAEHCNTYLTKGRQVYVEGRLKTSSYEKEGQRHYSTEIIADTVQFLSSGNGAGGGGGGGGYGGGGGDYGGGGGGGSYGGGGGGYGGGGSGGGYSGGGGGGRGGRSGGNG
ncbi:MAG: single-stranded DNA-binding protein, partial [Myxococcales bacterium]|nr:single-stranded DNA-binding protein [Myxococcales bacterium]